MGPHHTSSRLPGDGRLDALSWPPHPMNFDFTESEQAFAEEVRLFLRANPPETFPIDGMDAGYGSGAHSRAFLRALGVPGWLSMCWPNAHGGREQPMFMKLVLMEELALAGAPFGPLAGCWQTADAIIEFGTERLRRELLPAIARSSSRRSRSVPYSMMAMAGS